MFSLAPLTRSQYLWINRLWITGFLMWLFGLIFGFKVITIIGIFLIGIFLIAIKVKTFRGHDATWSEIFFKGIK